MPRGGQHFRWCHMLTLKLATLLHDLIACKPLNEKKKKNKHCNIVVEPSRRVVINRRLKFRDAKMAKSHDRVCYWDASQREFRSNLTRASSYFSFLKSKVSLKTCNFCHHRQWIIKCSEGWERINWTQKKERLRDSEQQEFIDFQHMFLNVRSRRLFFFQRRN